MCSSDLVALKMNDRVSKRHKDNFEHSLKVLQNAVDLGAGDFATRFACLMHDVGKSKTRKVSSGSVSFPLHELVGARMVSKRMRALRWDKKTIESVAKLVELHMRFHGFMESPWADSGVRRLMVDAGGLLEPLLVLFRADVTTSNKRLAGALSRAIDDFEARCEDLSVRERIASMRPALSGGEVMSLLGLEPSPAVGEAMRFLLDIRLSEGEIDAEEASARLVQWWSARSGK